MNTAQTTLPISEVLLKKLPDPTYVIDRSRMKRNFAVIRNVMDETGVEIILALKGFSMWSTFPFFKESGFVHSTASSLCEARLAYEELGCPAYTYSAAYDESEIEDVARLSAHVTFNSLNQFHRYEALARAANPRISFGLRVNPELHSHVQDIYNPCSAGSRLGVMVRYLPRPEDMPKGIEGFHCHALCESDAEDTCHLIDAFEAHFSGYLLGLKWVNFGGGHLMTRKGYDLDKLKARLKAFRQKWPHLKVILEPGAAFVWETGF